jgi:methylmalonyl-CoA mutase
MMRILYLILA